MREALIEIKPLRAARGIGIRWILRTESSKHVAFIEEISAPKGNVVGADRPEHEDDRMFNGCAGTIGKFDGDRRLLVGQVDRLKLQRVQEACIGGERKQKCAEYV